MAVFLALGATYQYDVPGHAPVFWDVAAALREVEAGHVEVTVPIDREEMAGIRQNCHWDAAKIDHVDPTIPGIGAPLMLPDEKVVIYILIDGTHRCVRALRDGLPFHARLLTFEAAKRCLLSCPPELLPW